LSKNSSKLPCNALLINHVVTVKETAVAAQDTGAEAQAQQPAGDNQTPTCWKQALHGQWWATAATTASGATTPEVIVQKAPPIV